MTGSAVERAEAVSPSGAPACLLVDGARIPVSEFLHLCAESLKSGKGDGRAGAGGTPELRQLCDRFITGGLAALARLPEAEGWIQFGVRPSADRQRSGLYGAGLYAALEGLVRTLLDDGPARDFFFMHKPPGIRLRIRARAVEVNQLRRTLTAEISAWETSGLITDFQYGVYEPESYLFGGPASMEWVHRFFTADSRVWLGHHSRTDRRAEVVPDPAWALSLIMVGDVLASLGVSGWEKIDVWDRVRRAGRSLDDARSDASAARLAAVLRQGWLDSEGLLASLAPSSRQLLLHHRAAIQELGAEWRQDYFESADASIGPREAAALVIIFHWNRAGLSPVLQAVMAEALADRRIGVP